MANKPNNEPYVDYGYCEPPKTRRGGLDNAAFDGEYLYENPNSSNHRKITFSKPDAAYFEAKW